MSRSADPDAQAPADETRPLGPRALRVAARLDQWDRRTVRLDELWQIQAETDPASANSGDRRAALATVLTELASAGLVTLSATLDRTARPALPTLVTLPPSAVSPNAAALARQIVWRPELSWALSARLALGQVDQLRQVNEWLRDHGHDDDLAPLRERSLEIFNYEKTLDGVVNTKLFGPGRLSFELLRTFRTHPPLPSRQVGDGPVILVVENEDTFHTLWQVLRAEPGPVGHIAWGAGGAFKASVRSVGDLGGVDRVRYFGDLDAEGLRIPRFAAAVAAQEALPPVLPATGLYRLLLDQPHRQAGQTPVATEQAADLAGWLGSDQLCTEVVGLLRQGVRIPQEAVGGRTLADHELWRDGL